MITIEKLMETADSALCKLFTVVNGNSRRVISSVFKPFESRKQVIS